MKMASRVQHGFAAIAAIFLVVVLAAVDKFSISENPKLNYLTKKQILKQLSKMLLD